MKGIFIAILFLFTLGVAFGFVEMSMTENDLIAVYDDVVNTLFDNLNYLADLGNTALQFFQKTVGAVTTISQVLLERLSAQWEFFKDNFILFKLFN